MSSSICSVSDDGIKGNIRFVNLSDPSFSISATSGLYVSLPLFSFFAMEPAVSDRMQCSASEMLPVTFGREFYRGNISHILF